MLSNPTPGLTFGALNLIGVASDIANFGYTFEALGDDTDWGNPVPVDEKVISWLQDGAIIARKNYDNREILVRVRIRAATDAGLAAGESALMLETGKPNLLTWTPPGSGAVPSVFSVVMSNLEHVLDDLNEDRLIRVYGLRIQATPFVRSKTLATVTKAAPALVTQNFTLVDACTSFTGWTGSAPTSTGNSSGTSGGSVFITGTGYPPSIDHTLILSRTGLSSSLTGNPYLRLQVGFAATGFDSLGWGSTLVSVDFNGIAVTPSAQYGYEYWFDLSGTGITTLNSIVATALISGPFSVAGSTSTFSIADVSISNVFGLPLGSTNRQLARTVPVVGSTRTQGNLVVSDASASLGTTLVYTCPVFGGMNQPNLRQFRNNGGSETTDSTTVSGKTDPFTIPLPEIWHIPTVGLQPGGHVLMALIKNSTTADKTLTWTAQTFVNSASAVVDAGQSGSVSVSFVANTWTLVTIGTMTLPTRKVGVNGKVKITLGSSSGSTVTLDEAWLFNIEVGQLTVVDCGTASPVAPTAANRLFLDAPNVANPSPSVYLGVAADRTDQWHAGSEMSSFGNHEFVPPAMNVFTVTSNSQASSITLSHFPRYHTHAVA